MSLSPRATPWKKILIVLLFLCGIGAFFGFDGDQWWTLETIKEHRDLLKEYTRDHYLLMFLSYSTVYAVAIALSLPGGIILSLTSGLLFGRWMGLLLIVISATVGATLVFLAARYLFADFARQHIQQNKLAAKLIAGFHDNAFHYLLFLRLVPAFPFWLVNLAPAFTLVSTRVYLSATALGIIPGSFVFSNLGQSLGHIDTLNQLVFVEILIRLGLLGLFALVPILIKRP